MDKNRPTHRHIAKCGKRFNVQKMQLRVNVEFLQNVTRYTSINGTQ